MAIYNIPVQRSSPFFLGWTGLARKPCKIHLDSSPSSRYYPLMTLTMEVGDIWLKDMSNLYNDPTLMKEHWLILKIDYYGDRKCLVVEYLHLETGRKCDKSFSHVLSEHFDFTGNPYYKKVA